MRCKQWIFDMDGTLTDSMGVVWQDAPLALLRRYGRAPRPDLHEALLPLGLYDGAEYLIRTYDLPLDRSNYVAALRETVCALYETVELKPGVRETLARLRREGARLCICSNTWEEQCRAVLGRLGVADAFEFYLTAQGARSKHHPAVFFEAMRRLGGEEPASCMVCEDALYAARTAHAAGFGLIGIADECSRADEAALRAISGQFLPDWTALDWSRLD